MARWTEDDLVQWERTHQRSRPASQPAVPPEAKPSKYRNQKTEVDGYVFDSKWEASVYAVLKLRLKAGLIDGLRVQVPLALYAVNEAGVRVHVADYVADFTYSEAGRLLVVDAKGVRTAMYQLKKRWLKAQDNIDIVEVKRGN